MSVVWPLLLLTVANVFMTVAWYGRLEPDGFSTWYMRKPFSLDLIWATLCLVAPAFFMFRGGLGEVATP